MANMVLIESKTVGSGGTASIEFTNIPQTYTDLKVIVSSRTDGTSQIRDYFLIRLNSSTSGYSRRWLYGYDSSATGSGSATSESYGFAGTTNGPDSTASTFGNAEIYIPNYTNTSINKSYSVDAVAENNSSTTWMVNMTAGLWSNTAAITSITLFPAGGNVSSPSGKFLEHSTFYLYGISNVTSGSKATGGIVSSDGTYWYHMFPYSGTFTPTSAISADVLCIAGGAAGGFDGGGGGGAGGIIYFASQSLTATGYSVTVGAGGAGGGTTFGNPGSNSVFGSLTAAVGGGGGGAGGINNAQTGGSGGGGASVNARPGAASTQTGSGATNFYGNSGGTGNNTASGGGGGGAGAAGATGGTGGTGGAGGAGISTYSSWASATQTGVNNGYYGGGGGGGTGFGGVGGNGGTGGGGTGGGPNSVNPTAGIVNTGGGGGGGNGNPATSASGGSGLVIIRYAI